MKKILLLTLFGALLLAAVPVVSAQATVKAGTPVLITSCGQSPGPVML